MRLPFGRLAQLVRATGLHPVGRRFESCAVHHLSHNPRFALNTMETLMIGWTTINLRENATTLSTVLLEKSLAVCAQIEGLVSSIYKWEGKITEYQEYRITVKFLENKALPIKTWIEDNHPYTTAQWIATRAADASKAYLRWAHEC